MSCVGRGPLQTPLGGAAAEAGEPACPSLLQHRRVQARSRQVELRAWGCPRGLAWQQKANCSAAPSRCAASRPGVPWPSCARVPAGLTQSPLLTTAQLHPTSPCPPTFLLMEPGAAPGCAGKAKALPWPSVVLQGTCPPTLPCRQLPPSLPQAACKLLARHRAPWRGPHLPLPATTCMHGTGLSSPLPSLAVPPQPCCGPPRTLICVQIWGGDSGLIARLCLASPEAREGACGDKRCCLPPLALCCVCPAPPQPSLLPEPPGLLPSRPGLGCTACTLPGPRSQPPAKRGGTGVGAGASPVPTAGRSWAAGATAQAPAPLGGLIGWLRALARAHTPRARAGVSVRACRPRRCCTNPSAC